MSKVRVLIVDDSAVVRQLLKEILSQDDSIEVVGVAMDPYVAREKIKKLKPDVLTLDVEMPKMDGISFLKNLMRLHPLPVIMISSLTTAGAEVALEALEIGAIDVIGKPKDDVAMKLGDYAQEIISKVKVAARSRHHIGFVPREEREERGDVSVVGRIKKRGIAIDSCDVDRTIIAIGASTGGTEAIKEVLLQAHPRMPAIVITQHIPPTFSTAFAKRMNSISKMSVCEASDGQKILPGHAYIAPGDRHLAVVRQNGGYACRLLDSEPVNRHRPSVDVLFDSVNDVVGRDAIGILLTGMGADGARGLLRMQQAGAMTIAQDEESSVVWGMPGEAVKLGAADKVLSIESIADSFAAIDRDKQ